MTMEVSFTVSGHPDDVPDEHDFFMVIGTREDWEAIMGNVDNIGHSRPMLELLQGLKGWGLRKNKGCC